MEERKQPINWLELKTVLLGPHSLGGGIESLNSLLLLGTLLVA